MAKSNKSASEIEQLFIEAERAKNERARNMPTVNSAMVQMIQAQKRLKELGVDCVVSYQKKGAEACCASLQGFLYSGGCPDGNWCSPGDCDVLASNPSPYRCPTKKQVE